MANGKLQKDAEKAVAQRAAKQAVKQRRPNKSEALRVHAAPGENSKYLTHSLHMWDWERPDMADPAAVKERIQKYFQLCANDDMKPSVEGLAVAFCVDRRSVIRWANGEVRGVPPESVAELKRAYTVLNLQMADYMQDGRIHPVSGIFLMKNNMGYTDQTEVVLTPNNPVGDATDQAQLEADYIIDVTDQQ